MRYFKVFGVLAVALLSTGCLRLTYTLNVKPDGSGTVSTTFAVAQSMMQQVGMMMGSATGSPLPTEAQMRQAAKAMGPATRFMGATPYKAGGFEGTTALYAFDDLNKVTLNLEQAIAGIVNSPQIGGQVDPASEVKLSFAREGDSTVVVLGMPEIPEPSEEIKQQAGAAAPPPSSPQADAMMKQMLGGMLLEVALDVQGKIVNTNAPYVEGTKVVLLRLDGDTLIKSGAGLGALMQLGAGTGQIQERLRKVPGLKVVTLREVRVEFK